MHWYRTAGCCNLPAKPRPIAGWRFIDAYTTAALVAVLLTLRREEFHHGGRQPSSLALGGGVGGGSDYQVWIPSGNPAERQVQSGYEHGNPGTD
jgi:hypothetical protein